MKSPTQIPRSAFVLGWLGVLPFAALTLSAATGGGLSRATALNGLVAYGAIILSFMGGAQWGLAMTATHANPGSMGVRLTISVLPALAAFGLSFLRPTPALLGLAAAFVALLVFELATANSDAGPSWYPALRVQLTGAVVVCLLITAFLGSS